MSTDFFYYQLQWVGVFHSWPGRLNVRTLVYTTCTCTCTCTCTLAKTKLELELFGCWKCGLIQWRECSSGNRKLLLDLSKWFHFSLMTWEVRARAVSQIYYWLVGRARFASVAPRGPLLLRFDKITCRYHDCFKDKRAVRLLRAEIVFLLRSSILNQQRSSWRFNLR